jgi:hypothetical protein
MDFGVFLSSENVVYSWKASMHNDALADFLNTKEYTPISVFKSVAKIGIN